jgi:hypothetical protein
MTRDEAHLKQVANEVCSNVRNCKMIMKSPFTFAKNVDEMEQHGESSPQTLNPSMQDHDEKNYKTTSNSKPFYARPR